MTKKYYYCLFIYENHESVVDVIISVNRKLKTWEEEELFRPYIFDKMSEYFYTSEVEEREILEMGYDEDDLHVITKLDDVDFNDKFDYIINTKNPNWKENLINYLDKYTKTKKMKIDNRNFSELLIKVEE